MSVFGYTFWILFIQYIDIIMIVNCKSIIKTTSTLAIPVRSQQTTKTWNIPTISPENFPDRNPYLYYTTITFGIIIVGSSILLITRACVRTCETNSRYYCPHHCPRPVLTRFRLSLVSTDAILISGEESQDKPPDYTTIVPANEDTSKYCRPKDKQTYFYSESPPPSYGSIAHQNSISTSQYTYLPSGKSSIQSNHGDSRMKSNFQ